MSSFANPIVPQFNLRTDAPEVFVLFQRDNRRVNAAGNSPTEPVAEDFFQQFPSHEYIAPTHCQ